jgi:hypothetical protein
VSDDDKTGLYALPLEPSAPATELQVGYPGDYRDPPWDGSMEQFRDVVIPARMNAIKRSFDQTLADMGFPALRWEWEDAASQQDAPGGGEPFPPATTR